MGNPLVKGTYEELAPILRFDRAFGHQAAVLRVKRAAVILFSPACIGDIQRLLRRSLHNGNELHELRLHLVAKEPIDLHRVSDVGVVNRAQNVELHVMLLHRPHGAHHLEKCRSATFVHALAARG